jgi:hypothetical protein
MTINSAEWADRFLAMLFVYYGLQIAQQREGLDNLADDGQGRPSTFIADSASAPSPTAK